LKPDKYQILDARSGQKVAELEFLPGCALVLTCQDAHIRAELQRLVGHDLLTVDDPDDFGDPVDEGAMCYLGQRSVTPADPAYLTVLIRQLPLLTHYEIREIKNVER